MTRTRSILKALAGVGSIITAGVGSIITLAAQIKPDDASSNLSAWYRLSVGALTNLSPPEWLLSPSADNWGRAIGISILLVSAVGYLILRSRVSRKASVHSNQSESADAQLEMLSPLDIPEGVSFPNRVDLQTNKPMGKAVFVRVGCRTASSLPVAACIARLTAIHIAGPNGWEPLSGYSQRIHLLRSHSRPEIGQVDTRADAYEHFDVFPNEILYIDILKIEAGTSHLEIEGLCVPARYRGIFSKQGRYRLTASVYGSDASAEVEFELEVGACEIAVRRAMPRKDGGDRAVIFAWRNPGSPDGDMSVKEIIDRLERYYLPASVRSDGHTEFLCGQFRDAAKNGRIYVRGKLNGSHMMRNIPQDHWYSLELMETTVMHRDETDVIAWHPTGGLGEYVEMVVARVQADNLWPVPG